MQGILIRGRRTNSVQLTTHIHNLPLPIFKVLGAKDQRCYMCGEQDAGHAILEHDYFFCSWCHAVYNLKDEQTFFAKRTENNAN